MLRTPTPRSALPFFAVTDPRPRFRLIRRSQPLLGGVAVLAVAGALSAGPGAATTSASHVAAAATAVASASGLRLTPVAYTAPLAAAPAAAKPAVETGASTAKTHVPSRHAKPNAPRGAAVVSHQDAMKVKAMSSQLRRLRACESGGNYRAASGNGYYGAYQFDLSTWQGLGLSGYPSNASRQLQDVAVLRLAARKGWGPWPVCSYVAGLR